MAFGGGGGNRGKYNNPQKVSGLLIFRVFGNIVSLNKIGGKGLFTKEIEIALLENKAHAAIHSMSHGWKHR